MNLALSDEQVFLREAARGALSRFKTFEAAREALDGKDSLPDLWPTAMEAGWPGSLKRLPVSVILSPSTFSTDMS